MKKGIVEKNYKKIKYEIHKKSKKNIILRVTEEGKIKISIPKNSPYRVGEEIIRLNFDKIYSKAAENESQYEEKLKKTHIKILGKDVEKNKIKPEELLLEKSKEIYNKIIKKWIPKIGKSPNQVKIKNMKTAWGICYSNKNITLNLRLIQMDEKIIEYVIVHELCHLHHMNHSKEFWKLVEKHLPNFREEKRRLKTIQKDRSYFV